jgi:hypothetical protein
MLVLHKIVYSLVSNSIRFINKLKTLRGAHEELELEKESFLKAKSYRYLSKTTTSNSSIDFK